MNCSRNNADLPYLGKLVWSRDLYIKIIWSRSVQEQTDGVRSTVDLQAAESQNAQVMYLKSINLLTPYVTLTAHYDIIIVLFTRSPHSN